jgi:hypothetical protein
MVMKDAKIPKNTDKTKFPLVQEKTPETSIPMRVGMNISFEDVNKPLIIKILKEVYGI